MDEYIESCLNDILISIEEIESYFKKETMLYAIFKNDILRQRAVERNVEIIGEAINRILKREPTFQLPNSRAIIDTRNRVAHGYDSVTPEFLWGLIIKHIPVLKVEIEKLLNN
ncbi:DUF86 domain-containing protein [Parabacteroides sp. OttesenSCG-928-O15]|nr:DUF86 domain-containing protein [Parabacteroides sp. OttesenSCG-928-O15]